MIETGGLSRSLLHVMEFINKLKRTLLGLPRCLTILSEVDGVKIFKTKTKLQKFYLNSKQKLFACDGIYKHVEAYRFWPSSFDHFIRG